MRLSLLFIPGLLALTGAAFAQDVLWYNGDYHSGAFNNQQGGISDQLLFADFRVTDPQGWIIKQIWSNNVPEAPPHDPAPIAQAVWSIRTGMAPGSAGVTLFGGSGPAQNTPTGRTPFGQPEYELRVTGLDIFLPQGDYWLQVTPIVTNGLGGTWTTDTIGENGVNRTSVNDGVSMGRVNNEYTAGSPDYSMGVAGFVEGTASDTPEPGNIALFGAFLLTGVGFARKRRK